MLPGVARMPWLAGVPEGPTRGFVPPYQLPAPTSSKNFVWGNIKGSVFKCRERWMWNSVTVRCSLGEELKWEHLRMVWKPQEGCEELALVHPRSPAGAGAGGRPRAVGLRARPKPAPPAVPLSALSGSARPFSSLPCGGRRGCTFVLGDVCA